MDKTIIAHTPAEMEEIGIELAAILTDGMVASLVGPLESGKTTLTKGASPRACSLPMSSFRPAT